MRSRVILASEVTSLSSTRAKSNRASCMNRGGSARSKKMKSLYCRIGDEADEIELVPERVELAAAGLVEHQLAERRVVAEVALHQVEAGREQPARWSGLRVEVRGPIGHEERVGKHPAKPLQRRLVVVLAAAGIPHPLLGELTVVPQHERLTARWRSP